MAAPFKDLFSAASTDYAKYRPTYPEALFDFLASLPDRRALAWDCGTGNGQAAWELSKRFDAVIATDPSEKQLSVAPRNNRILYRQAAAEDPGLEAGSVDLIAVAQALHWFDLPRFYEQVRRVSRPAGSWIAVWSYSLTRISPPVDEQVRRYYSHEVGPYWEPERRLVEEGYRNVDFPFEEIQAPDFAMELQWTLPQLIGYLGTWSATQAATRALGRNPLEDLAPELEKAWGAADQARAVSWPLSLRVGRINTPA